VHAVANYNKPSFISEFGKTTSGVATIIDEDIIYPGMPRKF